MQNHLFTSESVGEGHPDKVADQISDAILDACLLEDPQSRVACETMVTTGLVLVAGEITTDANLDVQQIVRNKIADIGYNVPSIGFEADSCSVIAALDKQSNDISVGVTKGQGLHQEQGAGDQGLMFGYACEETPELMPAAIQYSHNLMRKLSEVRKNGTVPFLLPDCKGQVTVKYEGSRPVAIDTVVVSTQHQHHVDHPEIFDAVLETVVRPVIPIELMNADTKVLVNPTGRFVTGGPKGDCGLTGRKIIVDTYGGAGRHGGGAFSGKDPSKVDRSAAYYARYVAKNIVASKLASKCEVQVAYAIGVADPVGVYVNCFGTNKIPEEVISKAIQEVFDFKPASIISSLNLLRPIYSNTSKFGHFGRSSAQDLGIFSWERTDQVENLVSAIG